MKRLALSILCAACLSETAAAQPPTPAGDGVASLLARLEQAILSTSPDRYVELLSTTADARRSTGFARTVITSGITRVALKERDRRPLEGVLPGDGYRLLLEVLIETGPRARLSTWRLDVRRRGRAADNEPVEWVIAFEDVLTSIGGLHRLSLNPRRQLAVRDLSVSAEDIRLTVPEGTMFVAEAEGGPTVAVVVGRGDMTFSPSPPGEKSQLRLFAGSDVLQSPFEAVFVRLNPSAFDTYISAREMGERPVDPREFKRAEDVFRQEVAKSFGIDLGDLSSDIWSLLPAGNDILAEIRTRRFDTLTYTRSGAEIEDISLYDRRNRRNLSVYSSKAHLEQYTRFYSDDDRADYRVRHYDLDVQFNPERRWIDGRARLSVEILRPTTTLTLRLADTLGIESIVSEEYGRLLSLRVRNQHSAVVNLPATLLPGFRLTLAVAYSGPLAPQPIDREALSVQQIPEEEFELPFADSYLYSNRSHWYPQAQTSSYATAALRLSVPSQFTCVASGDPTGQIAVASRAATPMRQFSFTVAQPLRYLSCLICPLNRVHSERLAIGAQVASAVGQRGPGVRREEIAFSVLAFPRLRSRAREIARTGADIIRYYTSIVGDFPFPSMTIALVERRLPGGHSPGYMAVLSQPAPGVQRARWQDDPSAFPNYPEFFVAHEIAHQWWGQGVGWKNYHEQWLSEGFAQYFAALYAERARGRGMFDSILRQAHSWATNESDQGPVYLGYRVGHVKGDSRLFRAVVYNKSALVLHMLRRLIGDEAFFAGIRRFYAAHRFQKAGTEDLRRAMEETSKVSLERFFEQWIHGDRLPQVSVSSRTEETASGPVVVLRFEQTGEPFHLAVTATVDYVDKPAADVLVKLTEPIVEVRVPLSGRLRRVEINRDSGALGEFRQMP